MSAPGIPAAGAGAPSPNAATRSPVIRAEDAAAFGAALAGALAALFGGVPPATAPAAPASGSSGSSGSSAPSGAPGEVPGDSAAAGSDAAAGAATSAEALGGTPSAALGVRAAARRAGRLPASAGLPTASPAAGVAGAAGSAAPAPARGAPAAGAGEPASPGAAAAATNAGAGTAPASDAPAPATPATDGAGGLPALAGLNPVFRARLARVIQRMHDQYGTSVRVVETVRSQARQDRLYEQGRTRPGPVVTWTHHSNHTLGLAADLEVGGSWTDAPGYQTLARVAAEEGLVTLGPADPGHVELRGADAPGETGPAALAPAGLMVPNGADPRAGGPAGARAPLVAQVAQVAQVAAVAPVARPAQVASVAQVAQVAVPGVGASPARTGAPDARPSVGPGAATPATAPRPARPGAPDARPSVGPGAATPAATLTPAPAGAGGGAQSGLDADGRSDQEHGRDGAHRQTPAGTAAADANLAARGLPGDGAAGPAGPSTPAAVRGPDHAPAVDMSARVAQVQAARDDAALRPLSRVLLHVGEGADGGTVRVTLRGASVDASIDLRDASSAGRLGAQIDDLRQALRQQGYDSGSLAVRATGTSTQSALSPAVAPVERVLAAAEAGLTQREPRDGSPDAQRGAPDGAQHQRPRPRREQRKESDA